MGLFNMVSPRTQVIVVVIGAMRYSLTVLLMAPEESLVLDENVFCLQFDSGLVGDDSGRRVAAHVERVQLP